jgi:RNA polymerase sigma factor (sigma-70 family)
MSDKPVQPTAAEAEELPTRASLLGKLRDHEDDRSWQEFFERYWRLIYRTALSEGLSDAEAQDVVQEVLLQVSWQIGEFRYDSSRSFKGWLLRTTHWKVVDQFRRRGRKPESFENSVTSAAVFPNDSLPPELEAYWDTEWEAALWRAALGWLKTQVSDEHYQIFDLHVLKERPVAEVARALGVAPATVYVVKHRVSHLLRPELARLREQPL